MRLFLSFLSFICILSCQSQVPIDDITNQPSPTDGDKQFSNVFKPLDGTWKGNFEIYEDAARVPLEGRDLKKLSLVDYKKPNLKKTLTIQVEQVYTSETPYFQRVKIKDYYPDQDKTEVSEGVNKIQDGKMWCVVRKPSETVIHKGSTDGPETIIWQRNEQDPQKKEYFYETVTASTYEIMGWGYYEGDDPNLTPKYWFYGKYEKQ